MVQGWYTGASGMIAQQNRLDAISNNLANVDTTGYKRDVVASKSFPELLIRRTPTSMSSAVRKELILLLMPLMGRKTLPRPTSPAMSPSTSLAVA